MKSSSPLPNLSKKKQPSAHPHAYTIVETLIAAGVLLLVLAAAASLSFTLSRQEEDSQQAAVAINYAEQAARLWQLGFNATDIPSLLPPNPTILSLTFSSPQNLTLQDGNQTLSVSHSNLTVTFAIPNSPTSRSESFYLIRPLPPTTANP